MSTSSVMPRPWGIYCHAKARRREEKFHQPSSFPRKREPSRLFWRNQTLLGPRFRGDDEKGSTPLPRLRVWSGTRSLPRPHQLALGQLRQRNARERAAHRLVYHAPVRLDPAGAFERAVVL